VEVTGSGDVPEGLSGNPGFVYADRIDRFAAWSGGRTVWLLDPSTDTWKRIEGTGDDPGAAQKNGTFGRWRYSPGRNVFVLVNSTTANVFVFKPPVI